MSIIKRKRGMFPSLSSMNDNFFKEDDGFFRNWFDRENLPAVNVKETDKSFELSLAAPGMEKSDFHLEVNNGVLTISSEKTTEAEESKENYIRQEYNFSAFNRSFWLPEEVKVEEIRAEYLKGVLYVNIPKAEMKKVKGSKTIEIA
jgi:HSP20 family protein